MKKKTVYPEVKHHALDDAQPLSNREAVDRYIEAEKRRREKLLRDVVDECRLDPMFAERVRKALPKRGQGNLADANLQRSIVISVVRALRDSPDWKVKDIVAEIASQLHVTEKHARKLYDKYKSEA